MPTTTWRRWLGLSDRKSCRATSAQRRRRFLHPQCERLEERSLLASVSWINPGSGFWDVGSNWSNGVGPQPGDDVVISQAGAINVTFRTGTASINSLTTDDDTLDVSGGTLDWTGGTWTGLVNVQSAGTLNLSGAADKNDAATLRNAGTMNWTGTGKFIIIDRLFTNQTSGVFNVQTDATLQARFGGAHFTNAGTLAKSATGGTTSINIPFDNTGTMDVQSGTLGFDQNGSHSGAANTLHAAAGAHILFREANSFSNTSFSGPGEHLLNADTTFTLNGDVTSSNLEFRSGNLGGTSTISGTLDWTGGQIGAALTVAAGSTLNLSGATDKSLTAPISNQGTVNWAGAGRLILRDVPFSNEATGTFNVLTDATLQGVFSGARFNNAGTLTKSTTEGTTTVSLSNFNNTGVVDVQSGTLNFGQSHLLASGTGNRFHAAAGAAITFGFASDTFTDTAFVGPGVHLLDLGSGQATLNGAIHSSNLEFRSGVLDGTSTITGTLDWTGGSISNAAMTIATGSTLNLSGGATKKLHSGLNAIRNAGTTVWTGGNFELGNGAVFTNLAGGTFNIQTDANLVQVFPCTFINQGTLTKSTTGGTTAVSITNFNNHGIVDVQSGTLSFGQSGVLASGAGNRFHAAAGAAITFGSASDTFADAVFDGPGVHLLDLGSGEARLSGDIHASNLEFRSGSLNGTGTISGTLDWTGGSVVGTVNIAADGTLNISGNATKTLLGVINNAGTTLWTGTGNLNHGDMQFNNTGAFHVQTDADLLRLRGLDMSTFNNQGAFTKSVTSGTTTMELGGFDNVVGLNNTGVVDVQTGTLSLPNSRVTSTGAGSAASSFHTAEGATLIFPGTSVIANLTNEGTLQVPSGGDLTVNAATNLSGGTLSDGAFVIGGTLRLPSNIVTNVATVVLDGSSAQILNSSDGNALATFVTNAATGSFALQNDRNFTTGGAFTNAGNLTSRPASTFTINGAYTQAGTGSATIEIGGTQASGQFGKLSASGMVSLDGALDVRLVNGFGPFDGQSYQVMNFSSRSGDFREIDGLHLGRVQLFEAVRTATNVTLNALVDATDLAAEDIIVPPTGTPGQDVTISYTVRNLRTPPALDNWFDSVYLSRDGTLDANDLLIGRVEHVGGVAGLTTYSEPLTAPLPAAVEADYRVIVVADSRGLAPDSNRANNTFVSAGVIRAQLPVLPLGGSVAGTIANGQDLYYRLDVPPATDVRLTANFTASPAAEFYVRFGAVPTRAQFDRVYANVLDLQQHLMLTGTAGSYYVLLHGREGAAGGAAFTLSSLALPFAVNSVSPNHGSNAGRATATLAGSRFTPSTTASLTTAAGVLRPAVQVTCKDSNTLFATFDLTGLAPGAYDLRIDDGTMTATAAGAFAVTTGEPGRLEVNISSPQAIRPNQEGTVTVEYVNAGETDLPAPLLTVMADNAGLLLDPRYEMVFDSVTGSTIQVQRGQQHPPLDVDPVQFLAISRDGPAGVLPPGARGRYEFIFKPTTFEIGQSTQFTLGATAPGTPFDWNTFKNGMRPPLMPADAWDAVFANFTARAGNTLGQYQALLDENASYLSRLGQYVPEVGRLLNFAIQQADNAYPGQVLARGTDAAAPVPGLSLELNRSYLQPISRRYRIGAFGRGWTHGWEVSAMTDADGNAIIQHGSGYRIFRLQTDGSFVGALGGRGLLTRVGGVFRLRETDGTVTAFGTDGKVSYLEDTQGNRITASYTGGRLTSLVHSSGASFTFSYNAHGRMSQLVDESGQVATYTYDTAGEHLLSMTGPIGTTSYAYLSGQGAAREHALSSVTRPDSTHVFYSYDAQGRLVGQSRDGGTEAVTYTYPAPGAVTSTDATGAATTVLYNDAGQVSEVRDALGRIQRFSYSATNDLVRASAPGNLAVVSTYDGRGNLLSQVDPLGQRIDLTYDAALNRVQSYRDPLGVTTTYNRDARGNLLNLIYPDGSAERFSYNPQGNPIQSTNRRSQAMRYTVDSRGLVTRQDHADGSHEDFTYDARGNLLTAADSDGITQLEYDTADRLTRITYPSGRFLQYDYDAGGRRTRMVDHSGFATNYQYDAAGRVARLTDDGGGLVVAYTYRPTGRLSRKDLGNGTFTTYEYDAVGQLLHLVNHAPDGSVNSRFDYTYDDLGRRTNMTTLEGTTTFGHDALGQLTSVLLPNGRTIEYEYDDADAGNRISVTDAGAVTNYTANNLQQYTAVGPAGYAYDPDGNLIGRSAGAQTTRYAYDDFNRLVTMVTSSDTWTYEYDALGNRAAVTHNGLRTEYLLDPTAMGNVAAEYDGAGLLQARYVHSGSALVSQIDTGGTAAYYDFDALGSTVALTDTAGRPVNEYRYLPFGETLTATTSRANPFTYVGELGVMAEGNGLSFMRNRYYQSDVGAFTSIDPLRFPPVGLYTYAFNNPVRYVDPLGTYPMINPSLGTEGQAPGTAPIPYPGPNPSPGDGAAQRVIIEGSTPQLSDTIPSNGDQAGVLQGVASGVVMGSTRQVTTEFTVQVGGLAPLHVPPGPSPVPSPGNTRGPSPAPGPGEPTPPSVPADPVDESETRQIGSSDPNDIVGPAGFGAGRFVRPEETLPYLIHFENLPAATAPAQTVVITQQLDPDLDFRTFEFGDFGFGAITARVPADRSSLLARIDARAVVGVFVDVTGAIDVTTGLVTWTFASVDPITFDLPTDPFGGFLPPNQTAPEGEGFVSYRVRAKPDSTTATRIEALATIVFDENAPLSTPPIFNTIDAGPPTSNVSPLPATVSTPSFSISWSGSDGAGSGIATFDIFVSVDGGAFTVWLDDTFEASALFAGALNHTYAFFGIATDNVGLVELPPPSPDASTRTQLANNPPQIAAIGDRVAIEGVEFVLPVAAHDPDAGQSLTFSLIGSLPPGVAIDPVTGVFRRTPADGPSDFEFTVRVTDNGSPPLVDDETFRLHVDNAPPVISRVLASVVVSEGTIATNQGTFSDPGLDSVSLAASVGVILDNGNGAWTWSWPTSDSPDDSQIVTITATDSDGAATSTTFNLMVNNLPPSVAVNAASIEVTEGSLAQNSGSYSNLGQDMVALSASIGTVVSHADGTWTWSWPTIDGPDDSQMVTITATDNDGASGSVSFDLTVANVAPTAHDATLQLEENSPNGTSVGFVAASDPGADALGYSITGGTGETAFAINPLTGEINVADSNEIDFETTTSFRLQVTATDDAGATGIANVTINLLNQPSINGAVFVDANQNGRFDANETRIDGVIIELLDEFGSPVLEELGAPIKAVTSHSGIYLFEDLAPGTYQIHELQPTGVADGAELLGSLGGSIPANDTMQLSLQRTDALDYVFSEIGLGVTRGDAAGIGFWQNKNSQDLIRQGGSTLATWLTANFGNVFGNQFVGATGADVAAFYKDQLFKQLGKKPAGPAKVDAQFMAVALAAYFTSCDLTGDIASSFGFNVTDAGIGTKTVNVGSSGAAFGVANNTDLTILQLLLATNHLTDMPDHRLGFAYIYDKNGDGVVDEFEASLRSKANDVYSWINEQGRI